LNQTLIGAVIVVTLALVFYSIAVLTEQKKSYISRFVLLFLTIGLCCDISSTILMILGSRNIPITVHGFLGYSALIVMLVDTVLIWRFWIKNGNSSKVHHNLHLFTRLAFGWWIFAYIAGAIIAACM
jgi:uncharacterized repeat protein (TIGR03987 family)